jgi:hypothetical protein
MPNLISLQTAINNFRDLINASIIEGGDKSKTAMIRSSRPILNIHEAVKSQLVENGVNESLIFPPLQSRSPELKLAGSLKQKDQDICIVPNDYKPKMEVLATGLLKGTEDQYGEDFTKHILAINVRSQISSIQKNFDTLYERTFSEAQNLHDRCPEMVLGEVYMIAVPEYDDKEFENNRCVFKRISPKIVEKYIKSFHAITNRSDSTKHFYQYEATCLLVVDFNRVIPKIYNTTTELIEDGLLSEDTTTQYEGLDWNSFSKKLLKIYSTRFGTGKFS